MARADVGCDALLLQAASARRWWRATRGTARSPRPPSSSVSTSAPRTSSPTTSRSVRRAFASSFGHGRSVTSLHRLGRFALSDVTSHTHRLICVDEVAP
eukprot:3504360-Rhodomonas_salina.2